MSTLTFWPDDIVDNLPRSPLIALNEAAAELGQATKGTLEVEIKLIPGLTDMSLSNYDFVLFSKAMNFRYSLLFLRFNPVTLYPCMIFDSQSGENTQADTEEALRTELTSFLRSSKATRVVKAMLAQSR